MGTVMAAERLTVEGGCHCGSVRFRAELDADAVAHACNCSICRMTGFEGLIVPAARFQLLTDPDALSEYRFNTGTARHLFCRDCGVKAYYVPRSNPDGFSINRRCLDGDLPGRFPVEPFDGVDWERNAGALAHLSRDDDRA